QRTVDHVKRAVVFDLRDGMVADIPELMTQPELLVEGLVDAADRAALGEAVIGEVANRIGNLEPVDDHGRCLPLQEVAPIEERPDFVAVRRPAGRGARDETAEIGYVR